MVNMVESKSVSPMEVKSFNNSPNASSNKKKRRVTIKNLPRHVATADSSMSNLEPKVEVKNQDIDPQNEVPRLLTQEVSREDPKEDLEVF